ncbi:armadillo-type protein [Chaetomium strumarium]|uniref:Armadillo-type protein n=1 Tax=Chaetomium strumarium TaxID=1170767 RepID=A0AAJ0H0Q9_9PEZI|nr:armadillo-type protein [Chaetomium strumarium]
MPSATSGRIVKTQRGSKQTRHQKNHRWESFSNKISKLKALDPLRKVRRHDLDAEDLSVTTSYLRNGLEKWAELNLSRPYMAFKREINPLTESLAQILYHEDRIMDLLAEYIARHEKDALEPLLDLVAAFARDLGIRFEKHYPRALGLVVDLASKMHDVEVIEWTFAALAFLFKYLSRLLVPDLRPTYDTVAPLMGKVRNPGHIARFTAEAMSFLVKKAAAPSHKDKALTLFVEHVRRDLSDTVGTKQFELYSQGVMTMFSEAIKGVGGSVHTTGSEIFASLLRLVPDEELQLSGQTVWTDVCCGVLTSIIHHSTVDTFNTIEAKVVEEAMAGERLALFIQILGIMAGVRKGTRIHDWPSLVKALGQLLGAFSAQKEQVEAMDPSQVWQRVVVNAAIVWSRAPMDAILPTLSTFNATMIKEPLMRWYILFCSYLADLNPERFRGLFVKDFQKFIVSHWSRNGNEDTLCVLLPRMVEVGGLPAPGGKETFQLPQSWQDQIVSKFVRLGDTPFPESGGFGKDPDTWRDKCLPKYSARLRVLESTSVHPSTNARIAEVLLKKLKLALRPSSSLPTDEANFIVSDGLRAYIRMCAAAGSLDPSLAPLLRAAAPRFCRSPAFLEALLAYEREISGKLQQSPGTGSEDSQREEDPLVKCLTDNLSTSSHELRLASLRILELLEFAPDSNSALATMIQVEELPLNLQSVRTIAVHLRKLSQVYSHIEQDSWLTRAVPAFLFGMTTVPLAPVWDDAVEAMKKVAESKPGEEALAEIAFNWLEVPSPQWSGPYKPPADDHHGPLSDFACLNLMNMRETSGLTGSVMDDPSRDMLDTFEEGQKIIEPLSERARAKALKAFTALPGLAEKRSRRLVPHLFSFTDQAETPSEAAGDEDEESLEGSWSLPDRKALVGVFAQFNNPRVLYQSERVYQSLLKLLANGDLELQKLALKAILAWRNDAIKPYQEHLEYLLDEARFKNELTVLFQGDNQIRPEHRSEVMPVLLHLLYGRTISKKGVASGRHGLHATRLAVIRQLNVEDMGSFLDIALGELRGIRVVDAQGLRESAVTQEVLPVRKQVGLLNMMEAVINELGTSVSSYMDVLVNAVLYCLFFSIRQLGGSSEDQETEESDQVQNASLYKAVRTTALKSLCKLFQNAEDFDWTPYREVMVKEIISPRIEKLPIETTQGVSATWKLLGTWSSLPHSAMFLSVDNRILPKIVETLGVEKARDEVKVYALETLKNLINLAQATSVESAFNEQVKVQLLGPNIDLILRGISSLLREQHDIGRDLLGSSVDTVVALAPMVETSASVQDIVEIATFLLNQPLRKVNPKVKGSILLILKQFIILEELQGNAELKHKVYKTIASLFGFFKDRQNRQTLAEVLSVFATREAWAQEVADICRDLNAYHARRLDEPDYNARLSAFNTIAKDRDTPFTINQWMPVVHNLLYYIQQDEEFGVLSTNSADGLCKFISAAESAWTGPHQAEFVEVLSDVILPAIYSGARDASETVRREILRLFGFLVAHLPQWEPVTDLTPLVPESQESDKAFFFHALSPAVSRQLQSLRLLEAANENSELRSKHISQFFIPLLEHFIFDRPESGDDHGLSAQATNTIAALTASLEWQQYRAILRRFVSYVESKPEWQKRVIRLLEKEIDALRIAVSQRPSDAMDVDGEPAGAKPRRLATTLPDQEKLCGEIANTFLPTLLKYIHEKDETTVSARVPVGVIIAKLLTLLPDEQLNEKLPGMLTDICHILRSKSWESREMARDTLAKISGILGPHRFGFILKELRGALSKGYQLHVLSYTLHSILLVAIPAFKQGDLDYCLSSIVAVIMDDIFGATGQEKDAAEYVSKMKEVKSSKSQDSMELIAKTASITRLSDLTLPLQSLLLEKLDLRTVRKIDELLIRITKGLLENPAAASRDALIFCYEVIQEVYKSQKPQDQQPIDPRLRRYIVQKAAKRSEGGVTSKHTYKLVRFAIDILRSVLKKHDHLRTPGNVEGFLGILGDSVLSAEEEVKVATFKILTVLAKVPFSNSDWSKLYLVAHKEAVKAIALSPTTASDLAQSALKLISVILRDRRDIPMRDAALDTLLSKLRDDLTEPLYRHVTFNFLRSVLDRKLETASVYDTLDHVGTVMITNEDKDTRDLARGAFFQFLREYPQKRNRWEKQLKFIVANLKYEREGGRLSVMEVINLLLKKSADEFAQEVAATCFIPLVFVLANDDSGKCRLAAGELIKEIFRVADRERQSKFMTLLRSWAEQDGNPAVLKLALHAFGLYFEGRQPSTKDNKDLGLVTGKLGKVLGDEEALESDWELANTALTTLQTLVQVHPQTVLAPDTGELWSDVQACLAHPHLTVKLTSIKLLSMYLADFARNAGKGVQLPLTGSHGLELDGEDVNDLVRLSLGILSAPEVDEALAQEAVQIVMFLGGFLDADKTEDEEGDEAEEDEDNDSKESARHADMKYLFWKLASIIRKERQPKPEMLVSKLAAMDLLEAFCVKTPTETVLASAKTILRPLRNLTDPSIRQPFSLNELFKTRYEALKTKAQSVMGTLQRRLGSAEYTKALLAVGEHIRERRQQRSSKRKIEALTAPEKYGREKRKKFEKKKEKRKVRGREQRDQRRIYQ